MSSLTGLGLGAVCGFYQNDIPTGFFRKYIIYLFLDDFKSPYGTWIRCGLWFLPK